MIPRVYFDTNVFIAAFEVIGARADHAWWMLNAAEQGSIQGVTSELTLAELLSKPPEDNPDLIAEYHDIVRNRPGLAVPRVSRSILIDAAGIRRTTTAVKLPDAIHLATALKSRCAHFVTEDLRLQESVDLAFVRLGPRSLETIMGARR